MKVISVIPIARGIGAETLTYFSSKSVEPGTIVTVPLRKRDVPALVTKSSDVTEHKASIRRANFTLRKVLSVKATRLFLPAFLKAAEEMAHYTVSTTGAILNALTPQAIFEQPPTQPKKQKKERVAKSGGQMLIVQTDDRERETEYKSLIREAFAKDQSVLFILPTVREATEMHEVLMRGIEKYTILLHSALSKQALRTTWQKALRETHPVLIVATGGSLSIPRDDIGTIIVEREHAYGYKIQKRPYLDIRMFAELFAKHLGAKFILGDRILRVETLWLYTNGLYDATTRPTMRYLSSATSSIVDMRGYKEKDSGSFRILSDELEYAIKNAREKNERLFLFTLRRGLAPLSVCRDCGHAVYCTSCGAPMVTHVKKPHNVFVCHRCGSERDAQERCAHCNSWHLTMLGIGTDLVANSIKQAFPNSRLFQIDSDSTPTHTKAQEIAKNWQTTPGSILIGTNMALLYLGSKLDHSAVISLDSLFSIPDFRINEKVFGILTKLRSNTHGTLLIQTRNLEQGVLKYARDGNVTDFYKSEIKERERLNYPPFTTLIKISTRGTRKRVERDMKMLEDRLARYSVAVFPAFTQTLKRNYIMHALIRLPHGVWVDSALQTMLRSLPPSFSIDVDPENIL